MSDSHEEALRVRVALRARSGMCRASRGDFVFQLCSTITKERKLLRDVT
jgi:hypothetical protein